MNLIKRLTAILCAAAAAGSALAASGCGSGVNFETVLKNEYAAYHYAKKLSGEGGFFVKECDRNGPDQITATTDEVTAVMPDGSVNRISLGGEKEVVLIGFEVRDRSAENFWLAGGKVQDEYFNGQPQKFFSASGQSFEAFIADDGQTKRVYSTLGEKIYEAPSDSKEQLAGYAEYSGRMLVESYSDGTVQLRTTDGKVIKSFEGAAEIGLDYDYTEYVAAYPDRYSMTRDNAEYYDMDGKSISADSLVLDDPAKDCALAAGNGELVNRQTGELITQVDVNSLYFRGKFYVAAIRGEAGYIEVYGADTGKLLGSHKLGEYRVSGFYKSAYGVFAITCYNHENRDYGLIKIS